MHNEESLVVSDCEPLEQPTEDLAAEFKTLQINMGYESAVKRTSRRVISRPQPTVHEAVKSNIDKSWLLSRPLYMSKIEIWFISRPWVSLVIRWVVNLTPFKTPDITHRTGRVHFKTFNNWIEARRANCNTLLKDVSSFVSEKEEDRQSLHPSLQTAQQPTDTQIIPHR